MLGAKLRQSPAMEKDICLEKEVLAKFEFLQQTKFQRCGLLLSPDFPFFGASPDEINEDCVLEIKCPFSLKSKLSYINAKDEISAKCVAQMQLQMFLSNRKSCLFCVAEPDFEISCKVSIREVKFDPTLLNDLIVKAAIFWNSAIWNALQCKWFRLNILISLCYNQGAE
jgi:hypothetical protein